MNIISSMLESHFFISNNTSDIFEKYHFGKYWKYFLKKVSNNVLKIWKIFSKNVEKNLCKLWGILPKFLSIISNIITENLDNNFMKFCELYRKFSKIISKKFWRFWEILRTFSRSILENFNKYFLKKFRIIFWKLSKIVPEYHGKI